MSDIFACGRDDLDLGDSLDSALVAENARLTAENARLREAIGFALKYLDNDNADEAIRVLAAMHYAAAKSLEDK